MRAQVAKRELALECDYAYEARCQAQFRALVRGDPDLRDVVSVPDVVGELCTAHLLTTEWVPGAHIDKVGRLPLSLTAAGGASSERMTRTHERSGNAEIYSRSTCLSKALRKVLLVHAISGGAS